MRYNYSKLDQNLKNWFKNDMTKELLHSITVTDGVMRGLSEMRLEFNYPIAAIAGRNGSGKSTVLALAACAFHNGPGGFNPRRRKAGYYTYSDFFIQSSEEVPPDGIVIRYEIASQNWVPDEELPNGIGVNDYVCEKRRGGKWTNYNSRFVRNVVFLGIDRVLPHNEKSAAKSYRKAFKAMADKGWERNVCEVVGRILDKTYDSFTLKEHAQYRLPVVKCGATSYSGFNMGAGESALFDLISTILSGPDGMLVVIDEIELGLHEEAQIRLIRELKQICLDKKCQIICTTHSSRILQGLPPEARIFIEKSSGGKTIITNGISPEYATGKLSGLKTPELEIFVEDGVAQNILESVLDAEIRRRTSITFIGSDSAIVRHMCSMFREKDKRNVMAVFDGDKKTVAADLEKKFVNLLEHQKFNTPENKQWFSERCSFLPGHLTPEKWLLEHIAKAQAKLLSDEFGTSLPDLLTYIGEAIEQPGHQEIQYLADKISLNVDRVRTQLVSKCMLAKDSDIEALVMRVKERIIST